MGETISAAPEHLVQITVADGVVSGLLVLPSNPCACYVLAHGAGVGMRHSFMASVAAGLATRHVATLRYQFPYMERGSRRPDSPKLAQAAVRAAVQKSRELLPDVPLVAGGKSYGARMTSQVQAESPLDGVQGLAFLGFPLHPPGQPSGVRGEHLLEVQIPMLFLQGTRDDFAELAQLQPLVTALGGRAALKLIEAADHSFHVPVKSGRTDPQALDETLDVLAAWIAEVTC